MRLFLAVFMLAAILGQMVPASAAGEKGREMSSPVGAFQLGLEKMKP